MIRISAIIPVYNTDIDKLNNCILSILNQSFDDYEIIIVDDGSNDTVIEYLKHICKDNNRIKVYYQNHLGVSEARNLGVKNSQGEYVVFIDSDDYVQEGYFKSAINYAEKTGADLIIGGIEFEYADHSVIYSVCSNNDGMWLYSGTNKKRLQKQLLSGIYDVDNTELSNCLNASPCSKLYSRDLVIKVSFNPEITIYEDLLFNFHIMQEAKKICLVDCVWYKYIQYSTSSLHRFNPTLPKSFNNAVTQLYCIVNGDLDFLSDSTVFLVKYIELLFSNYYVRRECSLNFKGKIKQLRELLSNDNVVWFYNKRTTVKLSVKEKVVFRLVSLRMYSFLYFLAYLKSGR